VQLRLQQRLASIYTDPVSLLSYVSHTEQPQSMSSPNSGSQDRKRDSTGAQGLSVERLAASHRRSEHNLSGSESPVVSPSASQEMQQWLLPEISPGCRQGSPSSLGGPSSQGSTAGRGSESPSSRNERSTTKALSSSLLTTLTQDFPMEVARTGRRGMFPRRHGYLNF